MERQPPPTLVADTLGARLAAMPLGVVAGIEPLQTDVARERIRAQLLAEARRATHLGRYVVLEEIGRGAMGVVFAAYDPELDRKIALKVLQRAPGDAGSERRARLLREAKALAKLAHPNVVTVYDVGTFGHEASATAGEDDDGTPPPAVFIAMEYVDGVTLTRWLREQTRSYADVVSVMIQAGRGLAAAHAMGIVHRDFKPENVMLGRDGRVRVMDFGLAGSVDHSASMTEQPAIDGLTESPSLTRFAVTRTGAGHLLGTPAYMAPEQFRGEEVGPAADQFSFCVASWEALYGHRPFRGDSLAELCAAVLEGRVEPPPPQVKLPAWVRRPLERGLALEPTQRWPGVEALLDELERGRGRVRLRRALVGVGGLALASATLAGLHQLDVRRRTADCEAAGASIAEVWNDEQRASVRDGLLATGVRNASVTADKVMPWFDAHAQAWQAARTDACLDTNVRERATADVLDRSLWCLDEQRLQLEALVAELAIADRTAVQTAVSAAAGLWGIESCRDPDHLRRLPSPPIDQREEIREVRLELSRTSTLARAGKYDQGVDAARVAREHAQALGWPPLLAAARRMEADLLFEGHSFSQAEQVGIDAYFEAAACGAWDVAADAALQLAHLVGAERRRPTEGLAWARHAELAIGYAGEREGLRDVRRLSVLANVRIMAGEPMESMPLYRAALQMREAALGPDHPDVAVSLENLASVHYVLQEFPEAAALNERALAILEATLGPDHPEVARSMGMLAAARAASGDLAGGQALHRRAVVIAEAALGPDHAKAAAVRNNVVLLTLGLTEAARSVLESGDPWGALPLAETVVALQDAHLGTLPQDSEARFVLAQTLVLVGGDPTRAVYLANQARDSHEAGGAPEAGQLAVVEQWLAKRARIGHR